MATLPLISHTSPTSIAAWRGGVPITAGRLLADIERVAALLPAGRHVLNICADRYRFTVGFAASLLTGKISLLPPTYTPEVIRQLKGSTADLFCLTDDPQTDLELPRALYPVAACGTSSDAAASSWPPPQIEAEQLAAYVFASGSTGTPLPYPKTWGRLLRCVRNGASRLGLLDGRSHAIVGTVPPQHMYGFESSVLLALQSRNALCAERPFYPADICSVLASIPAPRVLISTPIHLRALLVAEVALPQTELTVCATAPLPQELARQVEERFGTRLMEIYGSTETGQIALRGTARTHEWQLFPDVTLALREGQPWVQGGHVEQSTPMFDVLEKTGPDRFLLHGRMADMVNIAGKRSSLAYLTHQLTSIKGVLDGVFYVPDGRGMTATDDVAVTRVAALVVAPNMQTAALLEELRQRIDPVFLPRPLTFVERLPRNSTGKLPQEAIHNLVARLKSAS